jgi:phosphatidate phosphatase APP1
LYEEIADFFLKEGFPEASFHLKSIRLKDRTLMSLFADPMESKISKISGIIDKYPNRTFVLVGDTGEKDPEVYGALCRAYPDRIDRVCLRDVTSQLSEDVIAKLNKKEEKKKSGVVFGPGRFDKAFDGVPKEKWSLFTDSTTI